MGNGRSLVAESVLEHIVRECKFAPCEETFPLAALEEHEKVCPHRVEESPKSAKDTACVGEKSPTDEFPSEPVKRGWVVIVCMMLFLFFVLCI